MHTATSLIQAPIEQKFLFVDDLWQEILARKSVPDKLALLNASAFVRSFLESSRTLRSFLKGLSPECDLAIKAILAIGQGPIVFNSIDALKDKFGRLRILLHTLLEVESFYSPIGGIIGYYRAVLKLLHENKQASNQHADEFFYYPPLQDITKEEFNLAKIAKVGICSLPHMAEIYPIGGAGDRLNLHHPQTGIPLPVAQLNFEGFSLLERLIFDLQAREYIYWKLFGVQLETPIVFMGSHEKDNITNILKLCQNTGWFGRSPDNFQLLVQPLVPQITENGDFSLAESLKLNLKPGGHGVIWQLASQEGVFDWLKAKKRSQMLIRQINNPISGVDDTLLTFSGIANAYKKSFGFVACDRLIGAAEGMLVLKQTRLPAAGSLTENVYNYAITNVEYVSFKAKGIQETPKEPGSPFSLFLANTNILFAELETIEKALHINPLPGLVINMKHKAPSVDMQGNISQLPAGRLESAMQNIADSIVYQADQDIDQVQAADLPSFIMFTQRQKSLSVTKNAYVPDKCIYETPESCYFSIQENAYDLLTNHCHMQLPALGDLAHYLKHGPAFIVKYAAALGPLYTIISQKIQHGRLAERAQLVLEIAELELLDLELSGSLKIIAKDIFGQAEGLPGKVNYSHAGGKCQLHHVKVNNAGIDDACVHNCYWKEEIRHLASMEIILHGNAEFYAKDVIFEGPQHIEVQAGYRTEATMVDGHVHLHTTKIDAPTWYWQYSFDEKDCIVLTKKLLTS